MGRLHRLSTKVCMEMAEAKLAADALSAEIDRALMDGSIDLHEVKRILARRDELNQELNEAILIAEKNDEVEAYFDYHRKVGMDAPPYQHLREKSASIAEMEAHIEKRTTIVALRRAAR